MVLRGRFTRLHHIPDHERWDSVICIQTWYETALLMHTHFEGSLLLVTGREGESPGNEVAVVTRVGALSNYDDDDNNNVKKQLVLWTKQKLYTCIRILIHFFDVHCTTTTWNFPMRRRHTTTNFPFPIWTWIKLRWDRWDSVICMHTWYETAIYAYYFSEALIVCPVCRTQ